MHMTSTLWVNEAQSDADFAAMAHGIFAAGDVAPLPHMLVLVRRHPALWESEAGELVVAGLLQLLIDTLDGADADKARRAAAAMDACPPEFARTAHALLLRAFGADEATLDPEELDDAVLLTLALLMGAGGRRDAVAPFLHGARAVRAASYFGPPADAIIAHYAIAEAVFRPKLVIWDLDDTLWRGTLADGDEPVLDARRASFVRALNGHGIVSAICSKNDPVVARAKLEAFGLWDEFVFPRIAFVPKGAVVRDMIADMRLRPQNVLFVDDNPHNRREVATAAPGIRTVDAMSPECDALLGRIVDDHAHVAKNRVADYRLIEARVAERRGAELSDEAFLKASEIHATFTDRMDNLEFADRIEELINRSNQLNYTASRIAPGTIRDRIQDIDHHEVLCAFVWDKYGYYGLVGAAVYAFRTQTLEHLAFSCRIMHMGVEDAMIRMLGERGYQLQVCQLRKPLPAQSARAITVLPFADPEVRARVLAAEAPRDWGKVRMRLMADCQSGAFHHYSRFRDEADFDNNPRLFSLPQMLTGEAAAQHFPRYLVYTAATDYIVWRWEKLSRERIDVAIFAECADRFVDMVRTGDRKCLIFLPPQGLALEMYELHVGCRPAEARAIHPILNDYWRGVARRHPDRFTLVELADLLTPEDLVHAHHYVPSALKRMTAVIDDWYATQVAEERSASVPVGLAA